MEEEKRKRRKVSVIKSLCVLNLVYLVSCAKVLTEDEESGNEKPQVVHDSGELRIGRQLLGWSRRDRNGIIRRHFALLAATALKGRG